MVRIKLRKLEEYLQDVKVFETPKVKLEQYPTPPHIASCVLYNIQTQFESIDGKIIADLGCGSGVLSVGSFLLGAQLTIGFELDCDAINIFRSNIVGLELPAVDCVQVDVLNLGNNWSNVFDTVVTNPPFGTKNNSGIDISFIEKGVHLATESVFSMHKSSTRDYIKRKSMEWNVKGEVIAELRYNIDACYKFHRRKSVDIEVDLWHFNVANKEL